MLDAPSIGCHPTCRARPWDANSCLCDAHARIANRLKMMVHVHLAYEDAFCEHKGHVTYVSEMAEPIRLLAISQLSHTVVDAGRRQRVPGSVSGHPIPRSSNPSADHHMALPRWRPARTYRFRISLLKLLFHHTFSTPCYSIRHPILRPTPKKASFRCLHVSTLAKEAVATALGLRLLLLQSSPVCCQRLLHLHLHLHARRLQ